MGPEDLAYAETMARHFQDTKYAVTLRKGKREKTFAMLRPFERQVLIETFMVILSKADEEALRQNREKTMQIARP